MDDSSRYKPGDTGAIIAPDFDNFKAFSRVIESKGVSLNAMTNLRLSFNAT